jgi:hypothetical protein
MMNREGSQVDLNARQSMAYMWPSQTVNEKRLLDSFFAIVAGPGAGCRGQTSQRYVILGEGVE